MRCTSFWVSQPTVPLANLTFTHCSTWSSTLTLVPSCSCTKISERKLGSERKSVICAKIIASDCCASRACLSNAKPKLLTLNTANNSDRTKIGVFAETAYFANSPQTPNTPMPITRSPIHSTMGGKTHPKDY